MVAVVESLVERQVFVAFVIVVVVVVQGKEFVEVG